MFVYDRPIAKLYPFEPWGFDNGAYVAWKKGLSFPEEVFLRRLDVALKVSSDPIIAVCPDIVTKGVESLDFSLRWLERLPRFWPWYLAVQDGMTHRDVQVVGHLFAGIFLGGSDKFKRTAYGWSRLAHFMDKKFHYGRAGTLDKLAHAHAVQADSVDSCFPLWTKTRLDVFKNHDQALQSGEQAALAF
jgi:hypothetical protein